MSKNRPEFDGLALYAHSVNGKAFYIGLGQYPRPYDLNMCSRNQDWYEYAKQGEVAIVILKLFPFSQRKEAGEVERRLIWDLAPAGNRLTYKKYKPKEKAA